MSAESPIDYDRVAHYYDLCVRLDYDVAFFVDAAASAGGELLELTAGTGRLTLPLVEAGATVTAVDHSSGMLARLREKLADRSLQATVVEADILTLDLGRRFDQVLLPFNVLLELTRHDDRLRALQTMARHLTPSGRAICTIYNAPHRVAVADGRVRLWKCAPLDDGGMIVMTGVESFERDENLVRGLQFYETFNPDGLMIRREVLPIRFSPIGHDELLELSEAAGLAVESLYGDYDRSPFDAEESPFVIAMLALP